jgi:Tfp pilus assembly protein PilX
MNRSRRNQRGITLIVSMILLVLITLVAVTTLNYGRSSMQIVGNLQQRNDSAAAAQEAIETAISTTRLLDTPAAIIAPGCNGNVNTLCVDVNGDGTPDVTVALKGHGAIGDPACVKSQVVPNQDLIKELIANPTNLDPLYCTAEADQAKFMLLSPTGNSLCTNAIYEIVAVATDATTQANVTVTEGVALRLPTETAVTSCP